MFESFITGRYDMLRHAIFRDLIKELNSQLTSDHTEELVVAMRFILEKKQEDKNQLLIKMRYDAAKAAEAEAEALRNKTLSDEDLEYLLMLEEIEITQRHSKNLEVDKKIPAASEKQELVVDKLPAACAKHTTRTTASMFSGQPAGRTLSTSAPVVAPSRKEKKFWEITGKERMLIADAPKEENVEYEPAFFTVAGVDYLKKAGPAYIISNGHDSKNRYDRNYVNDRSTSFVEDVEGMDVLFPYTHKDGWLNIKVVDSSFSIYRLSKTNPFFFQLDCTANQKPVWSVFLLNRETFFNNNKIAKSLKCDIRLVQIDVEKFVANGCDRTKYE